VSPCQFQEEGSINVESIICNNKTKQGAATSCANVAP
jgi:hypothetical protein